MPSTRSASIVRRARSLGLLGVVVLLLAATVVPVAAEPDPAVCELLGVNGESPEPGTQDNPYRVAVEADLAKVSDCLRAAEAQAKETEPPGEAYVHFRQTADIHLTRLHIPIGNSVGVFNGVYDGGGRSITRLTVESKSSSPVGLFGEIGVESWVSDLALVDVSVDGQGAVGALASVNRGNVTQVSAAGRAGCVTDLQSRCFGTAPESVGGLVGTNHGSIRYSQARVDVFGATHVGGLVGHNGAGLMGGDIFGSHASGTIVAADHAGGLVGYADEGSVIERSSASGWVLGRGRDVGGLVGSLAGGDLDDGIIESFATGRVHGSSNVGGLVGWVGPGGVVEDAYATGEVSRAGTDGIRIGGLVGRNHGTVKQTFALGVVTGRHETGTLIGRNDGQASSSFWVYPAMQPPYAQGVGIGDGDGVTLLNASTVRAALFADESWSIREGWTGDPEEESVWGLCVAANRGFPFLQWQYDADPCVLPNTSLPPQPTAPVPAPPGTAAATLNGQPTTVTVTPDGRGGATLTGEGFSVTVAPTSPTGVQELPAEGQVVLQRGDETQVELAGWMMKRPCDLVLFSDPVLLGSFVTDASGGLSEKVVVPQEVSACPHVLQVRGLLPGGEQLSVSLGVWVDGGVLRFEDVQPGSVHARAIRCLGEQGTSVGVAADLFAPGGVLTRGQAASLLTRQFALDTSGTSGFADVAGTTREGAIAALVDAGVVAGFTDGTFGPARSVSRGQFASMLAGLLGLEAGTSGFVDAGGVHAGAIGALHQSGVLSGFADGRVGAGQPITRAQAASWLARSQPLMGE